jgi:ABC-type branched-subunit amino acid transport system substrate-binding protein
MQQAAGLLGSWIGRAAILCLTLVGLGASALAAPKPAILALLGPASGLEAARRGALHAIEQLGAHAAFPDGVRLELVDDGASPEGVRAALRSLKPLKPLGVIGLPGGDLAGAYWRAAKSVKMPWILLRGVPPSGEANPGNVLLLGSSPVAQGIVAADGMLAPLGGRRVAVLHEPTELGVTLAAAFTRNLSSRVKLAGIRPWRPDDDPADVIRALKAFEAEWLYIACTGPWARRFVDALATANWTPQCLFCEGTRDGSLLEAGGKQLARSVFLGAPDPELRGRAGESLIEALERQAGPIELMAIRAYEAARRILLAHRAAESRKARSVWTALDAQNPNAGVMGEIHFEPHGGIRFFPFTWWHVKRGRFDPMSQGLLPTVGCGPPLGFGHPKPAFINEKKGKVGYLTYGQGEKRTIEQDLLELGLSTGGKQPEIDAFIRGEVLARAIRIANRLFRREADGSPIPGVSWGIAFSTKKIEDLPRQKTWIATIAGDDPAAGGRAFGGGRVEVYSTFLKRTMYLSRKLIPPVSGMDKALLDGSYRWGTDRSNNRRADEIRCLIDGFASAVGLTLSHEFGHLCGCGHDTEHPTSIMNVVAGAGATWESAVWIPSHVKNLNVTLGIETEQK